MKPPPPLGPPTEAEKRPLTPKPDDPPPNQYPPNQGAPLDPYANPGSGLYPPQPMQPNTSPVCFIT